MPDRPVADRVRRGPQFVGPGVGQRVGDGPAQFGQPRRQWAWTFLKWSAIPSWGMCHSQSSQAGTSGKHLAQKSGPPWKNCSIRDRSACGAASMFSGMVRRVPHRSHGCLFSRWMTGL